jgi:GT2 family glycosyltransferase
MPSLATPVSVVVPTRGRSEALARCLEKLRAQTVPCELIVVDDAPGGDRAVERLAAESGARLIQTDGAGPAAARNAGARAASHRVVCFTDDDCLPDPRWAELLATSCPPEGAVAGETVNARPRDPFAEASQLATSELQRASLDPSTGSLGFAPTCNLAVARATAQRFPFDERFPDAAGEDREWCARLRAAGAPLRYAPYAVVRHEQRLGARGFVGQQLRYGRAAARLRAHDTPLASGGQRLAIARAALRAGPRVAALAALGQAAILAGFAAERARAGRERA